MKKTILLIAIFFTCICVGAKENIEYYQGKINIVLPVDILQIILYRDGGTVGVILKDSKNVEHRFCFDDRASKQKNGKALKIYYGATHPELKGAKPLEVKGKNEPKKSL